MPKAYYITTPIYYVNSVPHIGTSLTTVVADICARYRKMRGEDVWFLTGTDENGTRILEAAQGAGEPPQAFVDRISGEFVKAFDALNVGYDVFYRTTSEQHVKAAQALFDLLRKNGHIYEGKYEGWYDVSSETFYKEADLIDGKSPDGNEVRWVSEDNWFFRLSAFEKPLLEHIRKNPGFLLPESRKNEVVAFIGQGLRDMCVTRTNPGWGIPVPGDDSRVIYVWFEALMNYLTATGWPEPGWEKAWPADVHWMGKEIFTRFHATLWPAMLMGAGLPLPKTVIAHGWFVFGDQKMSKSRGNVIAPTELAEEMRSKTGCLPEAAIDAVRYSLAALLPYEGDSNFNRDEVDKRYNADLANDLGNALNRSLSMAHKFVGGTIPAAEPEPEAVSAVCEAKSSYESLMQEFRIDAACQKAIDVARFLNKYVDSRAPWAMAKSGDPALGSVIRSMLVCLRAAEGMVRPFLPWTADAIARQLGLSPLADWSQVGDPESVPPGTRLGDPQPIFPRIEAEKPQDGGKRETVQTQPMKGEATQAGPPSAGLISIDEFSKVQLRVARILEAEPVEGADKLLKLQVKIGGDTRQLVAGIRQDYDPAELIGRQIVVVANLQPAVVRGVESQGMLLAAVDDGGSAILLQPEKEVPEGAKVR